MRPGSSHLMSLAVLCAVSASACTASPPFVQPPAGDGSTVMDVIVYADSVLTVLDNGQLTSCATDIPDCNQKPPVQGGTCGTIEAAAALGPVDKGVYAIKPHGVLVVGFFCSAILETGSSTTASTDFNIFGQLDDGASVVVEVSTDATNYYVLNPWMQVADHAGFQLEKADLSEARYVRITSSGNVGTIEVDAVQALRAPQ